MSTFKPLWGNSSDLDYKEKIDGSMYFCKDDASIYIDYVDDDGEIKRSQINAKNSNMLSNASLTTSLNPSDTEIPTSLTILNAMSSLSEKEHIHDISDIDGLQRRLDELTPPSDIETSEDVILKINQLSFAVNDLTNTINDLHNAIDLLTPSIGEIYITTSNENPSIKFGGTWEQIKDLFLLSAGDEYTAGIYGGESEHTLTIEELPSHTHTYKRHTLNREDTDPDTGEDAYGVSNKTLEAREGTTGAVGSGQPHNNMPPYLVVYVWKRIL